MHFLWFLCIFDCSFGIYSLTFMHHLIPYCTSTFSHNQMFNHPLYRQYTYIVGKYKMYYELKKLEEKWASWISNLASAARSLFSQHKPAEYQKRFFLCLVQDVLSKGLQYNVYFTVMITFLNGYYNSHLSTFIYYKKCSYFSITLIKVIWFPGSVHTSRCCC